MMGPDFQSQFSMSRILFGNVFTFENCCIGENYTVDIITPYFPNHAQFLSSRVYVYSQNTIISFEDVDF